MEPWIVFALTSAITGVVVNFGDKFVLEKYIKNYKGMIIFSSLVGFLASVVLWITQGFPSINFNDGIIAVLTGILLIFGAYFYFGAMIDEEASKVVIYLQISPVLVLILSFIMLGETIDYKQTIGFFLILIPTVLLALHGNKLSELKLSKAFWFAFISSFLFAFSSVVFSYVSNQDDFWRLMVYENLGWGIGGLIIFTFFKNVRKAFLETAKDIPYRVFGYIGIMEILFIASKAANFYAIILKSATLATIVAGTSLFWGILFGIILTFISPKIFEEDISKKVLLKKFTLGLIIFSGIWLVS